MNPETFRWATEPTEPDPAAGVGWELARAIALTLAAATAGGYALGALLVACGMAS